MTTENLTTTTFPQLPEVAHQLREQIVSSVKDQQRRTLEAVEVFAKATAKITESFPTPRLPELTGSAVLPDLKTLTTDGYALAAELLTSQSEFALDLINTLTPAHSA